MLVEELMNSQPPMVEPSHPLKDAIPLMSAAGSSCLIVVNDEKPIGIVTERDVTKLFSKIITDSEYSEHPISEVMTPSPVCVQKTSLFKDALILSRSRKLRHLPVIDEHEKLVGIVTQSNLVDAYVQLIDAHSALEDNLEELKLLSLEDPLLGIGNRRAMEVDLDHTESIAIRHKRAYSLALLDIDFFKKYNDHYGHQEGDRALRAVAQAVQEVLRNSDRVFRYGGEELLILMPETHEESAKLCCDRVRQKIVDTNIPHAQSPLGFLSVSIGVAEAHIKPWRTLVELADSALYKAKDSGRNKVVLSQT